MRLVWGSLTAGAALVACSSFGSSNAATDAGLDGGGGDAAAAEAAPPCPQASCGIVIASGQTGASEIVADDEIVAWSIDRAGDGAVWFAPVSGGTARLLAGPDDRPKSLQLFGKYLLYATGTSVHFTDKNGSRDGGSDPAIPANASGVTSVRRLSTSLVFTRGSNLDRCAVTGGNFGCGGGTPTSTTLNSPGRALEIDPSGTRFWFATDTVIRSAVADPFRIDQGWVVSDVKAMAVDDSRVYYVRSGAPEIYSNLSAAKDAAQAAVVTVAAASPRAIAVDATSLFFTVLETGTVMKVPKAGGDAVPIATGLVEPKGIALAKGRVFVALGDGRIVSLPKN